MLKKVKANIISYFGAGLIIFMITAAQCGENVPPTAPPAGENQATLEVFVTPADASAEGSVSSDPAGIASKIPSPLSTSLALDLGKEVTLTAAPNANSYLDSWSAICAATGNTCKVTINTNTTVTAVFKSKPILTVNKTGTGTGTVSSTDINLNCGDDCTEQLPPNTTVSLTAQAAADSIFKEWIGCDSPQGQTCTTTVAATDKVIQAVFDKPTQTEPFNAYIDFSVLEAGEIPDDSSYCLPLINPETQTTIEGYSVLASFDWNPADTVLETQSYFSNGKIQVLRYLKIILVSQDCLVKTALPILSASVQASSLCPAGCTTLEGQDASQNVTSSSQSTKQNEVETLSVESAIESLCILLRTANIVEFLAQNGMLIAFNPSP